MFYDFLSTLSTPKRLGTIWDDRKKLLLLMSSPELIKAVEEVRLTHCPKDGCKYWYHEQNLMIKRLCNHNRFKLNIYIYNNFKYFDANKRRLDGVSSDIIY